MKDYPKDLKVVYRHFLIHPQVATLPAQAACAAQKQGKFEPMYHLLFEKGYNAGRNFSQENIDKLAGEVGLKMDKFKSDMTGDCATQIQQDMQLMQQFGVGGTPAFFINGRFLSGGGPPERFKPLIEEELKKANERIGQEGTTLANYYDKWVLEKGKKTM
jgi:protein-disulfide isomerase